MAKDPEDKQTIDMFTHLTARQERDYEKVKRILVLNGVKFTQCIECESQFGYSYWKGDRPLCFSCRLNATSEEVQR